MIGFILADLRRLWAASLVILLLIAMATALGVSVTLAERALRLGSARAADRFDLVIGAAGSENQLVLSSVFLQPSPLPLMPGETLSALMADPRVSYAAPVGFGDSFRGYPIIGTTTTFVREATSGLTQGRIFAREGEALAGSAVPLDVGGSLQPVHGSGAPGEGGTLHEGSRFDVVGKLAATGTAWDRAILVPMQAVWHVHGLGDHDDHDAHDAHDTPKAGDASADGAAESHHHHGTIDPDAPINETYSGPLPGLPAIIVKPKSVADAYKLRQDYRKAPGLLGVFPGEVLTRLYATLGDARKVLIAVSYGAQALVAAAILLTAVIHVAARGRQIGALRAFGAPRFSILALVWIEVQLLVIVGVGLGFAIGLMAARSMADLLTGQSGIALPVGFVLADLWQAAGIVIAAGIFALVPAVMAYRQSPVQALRG